MPAIDEIQKPVPKKEGADGVLAADCGIYCQRKLGLMLALPSYASLCFLRRIAIAAAFVGGRKTLPGYFSARWCSMSGGLYRQPQNRAPERRGSLDIAIASMLQAALRDGLRRIIGHANTLSNIRDILLFLSLTPFACVTSATLRERSLGFGHHQYDRPYGAMVILVVRRYAGVVSCSPHTRVAR